MSTDHTPNPAVLAISLVPLAAVLVMVVSDMVLAGWAFDITALKSILPGWISMKANTAACFILTGTALLLTTRQSALHTQHSAIFLSRLARLCGLLAGLIGLLTLNEYIFGWNLGIDHWLTREPAGTLRMPHSGRMAPDTALNFVLLSVALWIIGASRKTLRAVLVPVIIGLLVATLALAAILSYLTPGLGTYGWFGLTIMALNTAILFLMLGMAVIVASWQPDVLSWSFSRSTTAAYACGMALLVFIGLNTSRSQFWMKEANRQIAHNEETLSDIAILLIDVIDAQAHTRGYIITSDEQFLTAYLSAKAGSDKKLDALRRVENVHAESIHQQHFTRIEAQVKAQFQWLQQAIDAERSGMTDAARSKMLARGEVLLDNFHITFDQIESEHRQLIQKLKREAESVSRFSYLTTFTGTFASLLIFLIVIFRLNFAMSERKLAEAKIQRMNQLYNLLSQCNQAVVRSANKEELFQHTCRDAVNIGGFKMAWIGLVDEVSKQVKPVASYGDGVEYLEGIRISVDADSPSGRGPTGTSIRENQPFWCQDFMKSPITAPWHESGARFGWSASAALPLHRNGVAIGALTLYSGAVNAFDEDARNTLVEMARDISFALDNLAHEAEHKQAERALSESESRFRGLVEVTSDWIWEVDENMVYTYVSPKIHDILGYEAAEIIGKTPFDLMTPGEAKRVADIAGPIAAARKPFTNLENTNLHKDGRPVVVETSGVPVIDSKGKFCGYRGIDRDITERKQAESKLAEQLNELRRWREATLGREMRVLELKHEVNELLGQTGQPPRYPSAEQSAAD